MLKTEHTNEDIISFGDFRLLKAQRLLERGGIPVSLGGRALDILIVLTSRAGEVISKEELMSRVWRNISVDQGVLRVHLSNLRRALGEMSDDQSYIVSIAGRGYCFVAPVTHQKALSMSVSRVNLSMEADIVPKRPYNVIGREKVILQISDQLLKSRFVSVTGTGGIGKTTVAISVGDTLRNRFVDGIHFIDLGPLTDGRFVSDTLISAFKLQAISGDQLAGLINFLRDKQLLLIIDSCEHVIEAAAVLAERIFGLAPGVHILATSREPLRILGEQVHRLHPLDTPPHGMELEMTGALTFSAVQLFVERAAESSDRFQLNEEDVASVVEITRRLDGIPLAIQLAASRIDAFGVQGVAELLDRAIRLFSSGSRTALPRHQTLSSTLDWSYNLLSESERQTFRRLSVFAGNFTLAAAHDVAGVNDLDEDQVIDDIAELVAKSLLVADILNNGTSYRFLDTTRAYALKKLSETLEKDIVARRHALYYLKIIGYQRPLATIPLTFNDTAFFQSHLSNIRVGLDWCLSESGDKHIGIMLGAISAIFFFERGLILESRSRAERLISAIDGEMSGSQYEMLLQMLLSYCLRSTLGFADDTKLAFVRSMEIAEKLKDWQFELRMLSQLHLFYTAKSEFSSALRCAEQALSVAVKIKNPEAIAQANTMLGNVYSNIGNHCRARRHYEEALTRVDAPGKENQTYFDSREQNIALIGYSRALWCLGFPKQSLLTIDRAIEHARSTGQCDVLMIALSVLTNIFILIEDIPTAEKCVDELSAEGEKSAIKLFSTMANGFKGSLKILRGDAAKGCFMIQQCLDALNLWSLSAWSDPLVCYLAEGLVVEGRLREAFTLIDAAVEMNASRNQLFMMPELLRIKGNVLTIMADINSAAAEECFFSALKIAQQQAALSWELRVVTSLAQFYRARGRNDDALRLVAPVYDRFTEGFETADLARARQILCDLRQSSSAVGDNR